MEQTVERKRVGKPRAQALSPADKELKAMKAYMKKITSSKKDAMTFLQGAGIIDKKGELAKQYRS